MKTSLRIFALGVLCWGAVGLSAGTSEESLYTESPRAFSLDFSHTWQSYTNYRASPSQTTPTDGGHAFHVGFDWMPFQIFGKFSVGVGVSYFWLNSFIPEGDAVRIWVAEVGPVLTYQFHFIRDQFIVPFVKVGASFAWSNQTGAFSQHYQGLSGVTFGGGGSILLNTIDYRSGQTMDSRFGINATYLQVEYIISNLGTLAHRELRAGIRFEI
jgi:hypothetical protein